MNKEDFLRDARKKFEVAEQADREQRNLAVEDMLFIHAEDGQWSEDIVTKRKDRPRYTVDRVTPAINQMIGEQRQTRTGIRVLPNRDGDEKTADIFTGLIRSIEQQSNAQNAYDNAFSEETSGGYGAWRILTEYEHDKGFDQCIKIKSIFSAASSVYFDPAAEEVDRRDAMYCFVTTWMLTDTFKEKYPKAMVTDFDTQRYKDDGLQQWFGSNGVRIAELFYKKPVTREIGLLSDGRVIDMGEEAKVLDELEGLGITVTKTRKVDSHDVYRVVMSGAEILEEEKQWPGKFIPIVPVFGVTARVNGKIYIRGVVRKAKDPQRIYNYATSTAIETTALTPKDPIWYTPRHVEGHESKWKQFPTKNTPFLPYNHDPVSPGPPSRTGAPSVQEALLAQLDQASRDLHATTGLEPASLGNVPELKSGKAIEAQQAMGDRGSFMYSDNLNKAKQYTGDILIDLIPRIYDTQRIVKIVGPDEQLEDVEINTPKWNGINQPVIDEQTGEQVIVNDLALGSYSCEVTTGPLFATRKQETVNQLLSLASTDPTILKLAFDLVIDNMDLNKGEEIKSRLRKYMIQEGTIEPTDEEREELGLDEQPPPDPLNQAWVENLQMQTQKLMADIENKQADTQKKVMDANKASMDALLKAVEAIAKKAETGAPITEEDVDTLEGQQALVQDTQRDIIAGQEVAGSMPAGMPVAPEVPPQPAAAPVPPGPMPSFDNMG